MIAISSDIPLADLIAIYERMKPGLSLNSIQGLQISVRRFSEFLLRPALICDLTEENLLGFMSWYLRRPSSPATVNSKRTQLLVLWRFAAKRGIAPHPPEIKKVTEPERIPVTFEFAEFERLLAAAERFPGSWYGVPASLCWKAYLLMVWDSGCRFGEAFIAKLSDLDLIRGTWYVPPENRKGRRRFKLYRLHQQTVGAIQATLFVKRDKVIPYPKSRWSFFDDFGRLLESAGLPNDRYHKSHCIRRTGESYAAAMKGVGWAAEAVGHSIQVAKKSYINPTIAPGPCLADVLPRPQLEPRNKEQLLLFPLD